MKLVWTEEAIRRLEEIEEFIGADHPAAASGFIEKIMARAESITDAPMKGRIVTELSLPNIREVLYKNYRIVYLVKKHSIDILTVFEAHRQLHLP